MDHETMLPSHAEWFATGHQTFQTMAGGQQLGNLGRGADDVLEVVQEEQPFLATKRVRNLSGDGVRLRGSNAQRFRDAVPELQRARQNPNARLKAMNLLGVCYRELGMLDLAMKQFEDAAREILTMDAMKKEIVYNLGMVYEKMGEREKSLNCMKQIYEADSGYKDVAERVEKSYQKGQGWD